MKIHHKKGSDTYTFSNGERKTHFLFLLSDLSAFGDPVKKPMGIRKNYRKCMKILLEKEMNELELCLTSGEDFEIGIPLFSRGYTKEEARRYNMLSGGDRVEAGPTRLSVQFKIPAGEAIKIYSIEEGFQTYLVNQGGKFYESNDYIAVEEATGVYF